MVTNHNQINLNPRVNILRPTYNFPLPSLNDKSNSRAKVYQLIVPGSRILDVGCDTGLFGEALQIHKNCIVDGVELDVTASEAAKTRLHQVFVQRIDDETSFDEFRDYNAILFLDVLEHLQNPWGSLKGALKALRPGGNVYIVVPNISHISIVRRLLQGQFEYNDYGTMDRTHLRWFTRKSLQKSLAEAGFHNIKIDVVPQVAYLPENFTLSKSIAELLAKVFPDQFGGSIIGQGSKPIETRDLKND